MASEKHKYRVFGRAIMFGQIIGKVDGVSEAPNKDRARSNVMFNWKMKHGYTKDAKIDFSGQVECLY